MTSLKKIALALIALVAIIAACYFWSNHAEVPATAVNNESENRRSAPDTLSFAANAPQLTFLQIKPVEAWPEPLIEPFNGRVSYNDNRTAKVFSPIAGRVLNIAVEPGQTIKAGDELLTLDAPDYALAVADQSKASADLQRKKMLFERSKLLLEAQGIARKDVELAEADFHQAEAELARAQARLKNLNRNSINADGKFVLRAPITGVVSERQVNAGSEIRPDALLPLFVITDPSELWVQIDLPEQFIKEVALDRFVLVEVDAYPGESFKGKISVISGTLDPATRRVQVRCEVNDPLHRLKPEMYARVTLIPDDKSQVPRVPNSALFTQGLYSYIFVEISPGVLQRRQVTLSLQSNDYAYVKRGLKAGERVVTTGALLLNSELAGIN